MNDSINPYLKITRALQWPSNQSASSPYLIGVLEGEGIGPEIIRACLMLIDVIQECTEHRFEIRYGGKIGLPALKECGEVLSSEVIDFCSSVFLKQGAIFCGPAGGRFVYDLRKQFDVYCKLVPIQPLTSMRNVARLKPANTAAVDMLIVRENTGGIYQGDFSIEENIHGKRALHSFSYDENQVQRILKVGIHAANMRRKKLCVITKPNGMPTISKLWQQQAEALLNHEDIELSMLEVDYAAYQLIADAKSFDVIVAPNLFGDIIADGAALLLGARGLSYSANFGENGIAIYQTGHGAAYDIAGLNRANPLGQMQSLAMMLHESFGLTNIAKRITEAMESTLAKGFRTADIMEPGCVEVGTYELVQKIAECFKSTFRKQSLPKNNPCIRAALLLIDLQNDFLDRLDSEANHKAELLSQASSLLDFFRQQQQPILHIRTQISADGVDRMPHWIKNNYYACITGTEGSLAPPVLEPKQGERILFKKFFNAFNHTELSNILLSLNVDTLILAGLYSHACIRSTALEAYERGYEVIIAEDAIDSTEPLHAELSQVWLEHRAVNFLSLNEIQKRFGNNLWNYSQQEREKYLPVANINNQWINRLNEDISTPIINKKPGACEEILAIIPIASSSIVAIAAYAAKSSWLAWRQKKISDRQIILNNWNNELQKLKPMLLKLLIEEIGKPLNDANEEMTRAIAHLKHTLSLKEYDGEDTAKVKLRNRPAGCYAIITPWNNPVAIPISKIAPALLFGNSVLWKPAPQASCISKVIMDSLIAAGLNPGTVNLLFGDAKTARALIMHTEVNAVSSTGSIQTGRKISALCSMLEKPLQAELGGNNACIIMADVSLKTVVENLALAAFSFAGQRCTSIRRFIVQQAIANEFEALFKQAVLALRIGDAHLDTTQVGPLINEMHLLRVAQAIREAQSAGARIICGGQAPTGMKHGYFWEPTVLTNVAEQSAIVQQETFGPVAIIQHAIDIVDAVRLANNVPHGLLAGLLTHDPAARTYFEEFAEAGILKLVPAL